MQQSATLPSGTRQLEETSGKSLVFIIKIHSDRTAGVSALRAAQERRTGGWGVGVKRSRT